MTIQRSEVVSKFADGIGVKKAEETLDRAVEAVDIRDKKSWTEDEVAEMLNYIMNEDSEADMLTTVSANTVKTQLRITE